MSDSVTMDHVGYGVHSYPHPSMQDWQSGRVEIGGHAERCIYEYNYWYPQRLDRDTIEKIFELAQVSDEAVKDVGAAVEMIHRKYVGQDGWWRGGIYHYTKGEDGEEAQQ